VSLLHTFYVIICRKHLIIYEFHVIKNSRVYESIFIIAKYILMNFVKNSFSKICGPVLHNFCIEFYKAVQFSIISEFGDKD